MLKNLSMLEHKIGDKVYQMICAPDSPLEHVKEALFKFLQYAGQVEDAIKAKQAEEEAAKAAEVSSAAVVVVPEAEPEQPKVE